MLAVLLEVGMKLLFSGFAFLTVLASAILLQGQTTGGPSGGGGGGGGGLTVDVTVGPSNPIVIGKTATISYTVVGGVAPYTPTYSYRCGDEGPWAAIMPLQTPHTWCAVPEGSHEWKISVTSSDGKTGEDTETIEVQGPDSVQPTTSVNGTSNGGGPGTPLVVEHRFNTYKGNVKTGPCWQNTCVYEWVRTKVDGVWQPAAPTDPRTWKDTPAQGLQSCSIADNPGFYFSSGTIYDNKVYVAPANWSDIAAGTVLKEYKQTIVVRVPRCGESTSFRYVSTGEMHFKVVKVAPNKVKHVLQP